MLDGTCVLTKTIGDGLMEFNDFFLAMFVWNNIYGQEFVGCNFNVTGVAGEMIGF